MSKVEYSCNECGYYFHAVGAQSVNCPVCESTNTVAVLEMLKAKSDPFGSKFGGCGGSCGGGCSSKKSDSESGGCNCSH